MRLARWLLSSALLTTVTAASACAQNVEPPVGPNPETVTVAVPLVGSTDFDRPRIRPSGGVEYTTGPGVGYRNGLSTLQAFAPVFQSDASLLFGDLRGVVDDDGQPTTSLGGGYRYYSNDLNRIFGANGF